METDTTGVEVDQTRVRSALVELRSSRLWSGLCKAAAVAAVASLTVSALGQGRGGQDRGREGRKGAGADRPAKVAIGQPVPELSADGWVNFNGTPSLDHFRDRIVVLFFFRTDDNSADSIPTVGEAHKNLSQLGVVIIGLTPEKKEAVDRIVKAKNIKFPVGYGVSTEERYQVASFPKVYLLDTAGILVNRFHPDDELEERIRAQMRVTPPVGTDPQTLKSRFEQARTAYKNREYGRAYTLAVAVSKLTEKDSSLGKSVSELLKQIEEGARKWLEEAKAAARSGDYDKACRIVAEISVRFAGSEVGSEADGERGRLMGDGKVKPKLLTALENAKGQLVNEQAAEQEAAGRYLEAIRLYRTVSEQHPQTEAASAADKAIERINADPKAQEAIRSLRADEEADRWLDIANRFASVEMYDKAREFYQRIIDTHPEARCAARARQQLAQLPAEPTGPEEPTSAPAEDEDQEGD